MADLLSQLYPNGFGARPTARTGMPRFGPAARTGSGYALGSSGSTPPPPGAAPIPRPMAAPNPYASQMGMAAAPTPVAPAAVPPPGAQPQAMAHPGVMGLIPQQKPQADPFADLNPDHRKTLDDYFNSLAGINYKGSHESALLQRSELANLYRMLEGMGDIDYSGQARISRNFQSARDRQAAMDAAMGRSGGGVGAAGQSALYGQEGQALGDYDRGLVEQRKQMEYQALQRFLDHAHEMNMQGLGANIQKQNSPGFFDELLGIEGSVLGGLIP